MDFLPASRDRAGVAGGERGGGGGNGPCGRLGTVEVWRVPCSDPSRHVCGAGGGGGGRHCHGRPTDGTGGGVGGPPVHGPACGQGGGGGRSIGSGHGGGDGGRSVGGGHGGLGGQAILSDGQGIGECVGQITGCGAGGIGPLGMCISRGARGGPTSCGRTADRSSELWTQSITAWGTADIGGGGGGRGHEAVGGGGGR